jgi:CheY-like chemotaxis protein
MSTDGREGGEDSGGSGKISVLVVEDEFVVSMTLRVQLESLGCEVVGSAREARQAIEFAEKLRPKLILMDIGLPGGSGLEAVEEIMAQAPTNIVVITAYGEDRAREALAVGARAVLTKPILEEQLASIIDDVARHRQAPRSDTLEDER